MKFAFVKSIFVIFLFDLVISKPVEGDYYVERNYLHQYRGEFLFCGDNAIAACAAGSIGCRIRLSTDVSRKFLHQTFTCINEDKTDGLKVGHRVQLPRTRTINIDLNIYIEAESTYSVGYGLKGDEYAYGVVALDKLDELKKTFREEKKRVDESNA